MAVDVFLGEPPPAIKEWIIAHAGGDTPDPVDTSDWGQIVAALEECTPSDFNGLSYVGSNTLLTSLAVGSAVDINYKLNGTNAVPTRWLNLGYNASIPEYVKYRKTAGTGYKHIWVKTMKAGLLAAIAVGDSTYTREFDAAIADFTYTEGSAI